MGLDTSHDAWHGGYGRFHFWRTAVAKAIGINLELMDGFYSDDYRHPLSMVKTVLDQNSGPFVEDARQQLKRHNEMFPLSWESLKPNALHELLYHSDCDGEIPWKNCKAIALALEETFPRLDEDARALAEKFAKGLRLAYKKKENLDFH